MGLQHATIQLEIADMTEQPRVDGYVEARSLLGYGVLVVTEARLAELVATAEWEELETGE